MSDDPYLSVIIPAYNEALRITEPLNYIAKYLSEQKYTWEIVIVNDGSDDDTAQAVDNLHLPNTQIIGYPENRGKGYAVNYGFKHSRGRYLLMCDADNSTPFEQIEKLLPLVEQYPVIIGSRRLKNSQVIVKQQVARLIASNLGNWLIQALLLPGITDTQCGFKLFSREAAIEITRYQTIWRWGFDIELLYIAKKNHLKIKQVPIKWRNVEGSKVQSAKAFINTLNELLKIRWQSICGKYSVSRQSH